MALIPLDRKRLILEDTKKSILKNHTLEEIAVRHGIPRQTLNKWLMSLGEEHQELKQLWIDNMLAEATEETNNVVKNYPLARSNSK